MSLKSANHFSLTLRALYAACIYGFDQIFGQAIEHKLRACNKEKFHMRLLTYGIFSPLFLLSSAAYAFSLTGESDIINSPAGAEENIACETEWVRLDSNFPGGNVARCDPIKKDLLNITIAPEDSPPINCSAWYAFRLSPKKARTLNITLQYSACGHRYSPKISYDGQNWLPLDAQNITISQGDGRDEASLIIPLDDRDIFVAAQELITADEYDQWMAGLMDQHTTLISKSILGHSAEGRSIAMLRIKDDRVAERVINQKTAETKQQVVIIGRQHPPEITGALALFAYVETLMADTPLARAYRARFETIIVPMLNPDGVYHGYWRHSTGHIDLNRDWGPFTQPETRLIDELLQSIEKSPAQDLRFFMDFHSTQNDIFYTIPDESPTNPPLFLKKWLAALQQKMPDYSIKRDANHNLTQANSKNYVHKRYGVPTVTYEMGDETDREKIKLIAENAAIAMMETLLH